MPSAINTIGRRLRFVRDTALELSRPKLADLMGIPPTTLKNYELGYRDFGSTEAQNALWSVEQLKPYAVWILTGKTEVPAQRNPVEELQGAA
ncbi:helix-turn-helix domain-containing protein [Aeromonas veronii]|uniref:helix-turn-helix domain-containing protein n=1 Tax=Aeromonas veronii TaxID=654 RepID=UPI0023642E1E|nr:helix-turn-helix transcriptional regulator [Aeromonas veronii]MDD1845750.1 helix-turn-helix domain-containing protein [Aeromonas veronii]